MKSNSRINIKKIISGIFWITLAIGLLYLIVIAFQKKEAELCTGIEIEIIGANNNIFIDKEDVLKIIKTFAGEKLVGTPIRHFNLEKMEVELAKDIWLDQVILFFNNSGVLHAQVVEREPVSRIFSESGYSFYIDKKLKILPLSTKHTAKLPVFTGFPAVGPVPSSNDSTLLRSINYLSIHIQKDSFLTSMIDQVDIDKSGQFELVPKIGEQIVLFGDTTDMAAKFEKFKLFYTKVIPVYGIKKYSKINLQYKGQVVAKIRGKEDSYSDSLLTLKYMRALADYSSKMASDTSKNYSNKSDMSNSDISIILNSIQRDENPTVDSFPSKKQPIPIKQQ